MIHQIGRELEAKLLAKGCPFKVFDREGTKPTAWRNVVVIEETGLKYGPPTSQSRNPKRYADANIGAKLTIYAQSTRSGASEFEHQRVAHRVADLAVVALMTIRAELKVGLTLGGAKFVPIEDLAESENPGGAVLEMDVTFARAVEDRTWAGSAWAEADISYIEMSGSPALTFADVGATGDTITRDAGSWIDDGFTVGMPIRIGGSASNNVTTDALVTVTALVLTLDSTALVNEGPTSGCTVRAGGITSCTEVALSSLPEDDGNPLTPELACGAE